MRRPETEPKVFTRQPSRPRHTNLATVCPETDTNRLKGALAFWSASRGMGGGSPVRLVTDFWQNAPRDLKILAVAIPILLALAFHPSLPKIHMGGSKEKQAPQEAAEIEAPAAPAVALQTVAKTVPQATTLVDDVPQAPVRVINAKAESKVKSDDWKAGLLSHFGGLRQTLAERAGVELNEDFRSGMEDWKTETDPATAFSFDQTGFVRPSGMALYQPSLGLKDYDLQFLGMIDQKALSWVVRARDFRNYYAVKLVVVKPGPMPVLNLVRYPVINGRVGRRIERPVRIQAQTDTLYRIGMTIHDDTFLVTVQGNVIDSWTDQTLTRGGVGFFSGAGEASRLRWLQVSHQYDVLGRLCAYLAPYNSQTTNGSW